MAKQLAERFGISSYFGEVTEMMRAVSPDVVHITAPPQYHCVLAKECLKAGSHVYLEKPFTVTAEEARSLIQLADDANLKVTAGHNLQFSLEMMEMRRLVNKGFLGGRPVHVESYFSYSLGDTSYAGAFLANREHWVRQLPGQLLHNIISHGVAKLAEFLDSELTEILATADQSESLRTAGADGLLDELRVMLRDKNGSTAFFCFSTQIRMLNELRIYGPSGSITVDNVTGSLIRYKRNTYKSYLTYFIPPLKNAKEHLRNARLNLTNFVRRRLYQDAGMKELIERFYDSIRLNTTPPIPYREIILTATIMDKIFAQIYPTRLRSSAISAPVAAVSPIPLQSPVQ